MLITITALIAGAFAGYQYGKGFDKRQFDIKQKRKLASMPKAKKHRFSTGYNTILHDR